MMCKTTGNSMVNLLLCDGIIAKEEGNFCAPAISERLRTTGNYLGIVLLVKQMISRGSRGGAPGARAPPDPRF